MGGRMRIVDKKNRITTKGEIGEDGIPEWESYNPAIQPTLVRISLSNIKMPCWNEKGKHKKCPDCIFKKDCLPS